MKILNVSKRKCFRCNLVKIEKTKYTNNFDYSLSHPTGIFYFPSCSTNLNWFFSRNLREICEISFQIDRNVLLKSYYKRLSRNEFSYKVRRGKKLLNDQKCRKFSGRIFFLQTKKDKKSFNSQFTRNFILNTLWKFRKKIIKQLISWKHKKKIQSSLLREN